MYSNPIAYGPPTATGSAFNSGSEIMGANTGTLGEIANASPYETIGQIYKKFMTNSHGAVRANALNKPKNLEAMFPGGGTGGESCGAGGTGPPMPPSTSRPSGTTPGRAPNPKGGGGGE